MSLQQLLGSKIGFNQAALVLPSFELLQQEQVRRRNAANYKQTSLLYREDHPFYIILHKKSRFKILKGGRGSAKSWAFAEAAIRRADKEDLLFLCTREYQNSITDSVHKLLKDTIERLGLNHRFDVTEKTIRSKKTRSAFIFKGLHNNVLEVKSTEGVDICWCEEAQAMSAESWKVLLPTIREPGSEFWVSFNPDNETDPTYKFAENPPDGSEVHHVNYDSNPYFPQELEDLRQYYLKMIADAVDDKEREQAQSDYDHVWLGMTKKISSEIVLSGKYVVQEFARGLWTPNGGRLLRGLDFGFSQDPMALTSNFIYDECLYIEDEAYGTNVELMGEKNKEGHGETEQFLRSIPEPDRWAIKADNARPETISFIRGLGFNCTAADKWPGSVEDGIAYLRGFRKIIIHPRCKNTAREAKMWRYKVDRVTGQVLPILIDKHNHTWDSVRYSLDGYIQRSGDLGIWAKLGKPN